MGVPSQSLLHSITDAVAARMNKDLTGFESEYLNKTVASLPYLVDAAGDPQLEAALMPGAILVEAQSLPENHAANLATLCGRSAFRTFASELIQLVSDNGFSSFQTYVEGISAAIHPLFAEVMRTSYGEGVFGSSPTTVFAPTYSTVAPDRVWVGADGALSEETTDAGSASTADVTLFASNNHYVYLGCKRKFDHIIFGLSTLASASITPQWQYWNGSAWATLTVTDNSTGLTLNDTISFTAPSDWGRTYLDGSSAVFSASAYEPLYYVRIKRTNATAITAPTGTCIRLAPALALDGTKHLPIQQPPLALIRITATNTMTMEVLNAPAITRWAPPAIRARALTPFSASPTLTIAYTDQSGNADSKAQSAWTTPAALDTVAITLNTGDTGVQAISASGNSVTSTGLGVIELYVAETRTPAI